MVVFSSSAEFSEKKSSQTDENPDTDTINEIVKIFKIPGCSQVQFVESVKQGFKLRPGPMENQQNPQ